MGTALVAGACHSDFSDSTAAFYIASARVGWRGRTIRPWLIADRKQLVSSTDRGWLNKCGLAEHSLVRIREG